MTSKKSKKGKAMSLADFHAITPTNEAGNNSSNANASSTRLNWAEVMEQEDDGTTPPSDFIFDRSQLPTAPKAALVPDFNIESIPKTPPFIAHLSNVSFEADEEKIKAFFKDLKVISVRLPVDERNRSKGYGFVDFADRESLIAALTKRDTTFNNRAMKITLDEPKQDGGGYRNRTGDRGGDRMGNQQQDGPLKSDEADWRRPQPDASQGDSESNWSSGGRNNNDQQQQRYNQNRDNRYQNRQDNQRGGGYQRRGGGGGGGDRGGDRGNWSGNRGGQEYNEGQRRQYSSGGGYHQNKSYGGGGGGDYSQRERTHNEPRNEESPWKTQPAVEPSTEQTDSHAAPPHPPSTVQSPESHASAPITTEIKERPRINIAPRTIPVEESASAPAASASAIFGAAKPVNTAAKEKEIEERLKKERELNAAEKEKKTTSTTESSHSAEHHDSSHDGGVSENQSHRSHKTSFTSDDGRHSALSPQHQHAMSPKDQDFQTVGGRQRRDNRDQHRDQHKHNDHRQNYQSSNRMAHSNSFQNKQPQQQQTQQQQQPPQSRQPNNSDRPAPRQPQQQPNVVEAPRPAVSAWGVKPAAELFNKDQPQPESNQADTAPRSYSSNNNNSNANTTTTNNNFKTNRDGNDERRPYNNNNKRPEYSQQNRPMSNRDNRDRRPNNSGGGGGGDRKFSKNQRNDRQPNENSRNYNNNRNAGGSDRYQNNASSNYDNSGAVEASTGGDSLGITNNKFANLALDVEDNF